MIWFSNSNIASPKAKAQIHSLLCLTLDSVSLTF